MNVQALPKVSILVPARNEASNIATCLKSLGNLEYPNFDVIVIDDASTDNTGDIARSMSIPTSVKINVLRNDSLPVGWVGKNHALHVGQRTVDGDWLLFTDADTFHFPNSLITAVGLAEDNGLDFLSYSPEQQCVSFWEKLVQPMVFSFLDRTFPMDQINSGKMPAAANGQYILVRRIAYDGFGGHEAVKNEVLEDVALARLARAKGFKTGFYPGAGLVRTRMYRSFAEIWNGWSKGLFPLLDKRLSRVVSAIGYTIIVYLLPLALLVISAVLLLSGRFLAGVSGIVLGSIILGKVLVDYHRNLRENNFPASSILYLPFSAIFMIALLMTSVYRHTTGSVEWKGRAYDG